jgi:hypothetical protein
MRVLRKSSVPTAGVKMHSGCSPLSQWVHRAKPALQGFLPEGSTYEAGCLVVIHVSEVKSAYLRFQV